MPLPINHTIDTNYLQGYCPSVGATPVAVQFRIPYRSRLLEFSSVLNGAITTADATVTVAVNGTTVGTFLIPFSGSAARQVNSGTPTARTWVDRDDVVTMTPSGASGASIAASFALSLRRA